ncbi:hypothetical protein PR048_025898 [Dryococelus australis]|uniref:Uncharacterized protein n=1 Tax=Dryococelus australis TaxID=614101 RepID=A0ABQ9GJU0_9NEOP|nr:hypothetical protein PR048_025898 [Dryococelus australis]
MKGWGKREITEKTHRPVASSGTIPACENPGPGECCMYCAGRIARERTYECWHVTADGTNLNYGNQRGRADFPRASLYRLGTFCLCLARSSFLPAKLAPCREADMRRQSTVQSTTLEKCKYVRLFSVPELVIDMNVMVLARGVTLDRAYKRAIWSTYHPPTTPDSCLLTFSVALAFVAHPKSASVEAYSPGFVERAGRELGGVVVRLLAFHRGKPGAVAPVFSHVVIVPDNAAGQRVFSGSSVSPHLHSGAAPYSLRFTVVGSKDLDHAAISCFVRVAVGHPKRAHLVLSRTGAPSSERQAPHVNKQTSPGEGKNWVIACERIGREMEDDLGTAEWRSKLSPAPPALVSRTRARECGPICGTWRPPVRPLCVTTTALASSPTGHLEKQVCVVYPAAILPARASSLLTALTSKL